MYVTCVIRPLVRRRVAARTNQATNEHDLPRFTLIWRDLARRISWLRTSRRIRDAANSGLTSDNCAPGGFAQERAGRRLSVPVRPSGRHGREYQPLTLGATSSDLIAAGTPLDPPGSSEVNPSGLSNRARSNVERQRRSVGPGSGRVVMAGRLLRLDRQDRLQTAARAQLRYRRARSSCDRPRCFSATIPIVSPPGFAGDSLVAKATARARDRETQRNRRRRPEPLHLRTHGGAPRDLRCEGGASLSA